MKIKIVQCHLSVMKKNKTILIQNNSDVPQRESHIAVLDSLLFPYFFHILIMYEDIKRSRSIFLEQGNLNKHLNNNIIIFVSIVVIKNGVNCQSCPMFLVHQQGLYKCNFRAEGLIQPGSSVTSILIKFAIQIIGELIPGCMRSCQKLKRSIVQ